MVKGGRRLALVGWTMIYGVKEFDKGRIPLTLTNQGQRCPRLDWIRRAGGYLHLNLAADSQVGKAPIR